LNNQRELVGHVRHPKLADISLKISYGFFFFFIVALCSLLASITRGKHSAYPALFGFLILIAVVWQALTLCHNRNNLVAWLLAILYGIMAIIFLIYVLQNVVSAAPPMKRIPNDELIDEHYLRDVFAPSSGDQASRSALSNSVNELEEHLAECRAFLHQVEVGKIPVTQDFKGTWTSNVEQDDASVSAGYSGREGAVIDFQKRKKPSNTLIYGFRFSTNGCLIWADTVKHGFKFDEHGKIQSYW
jgi:hypothetical protein